MKDVINNATFFKRNLLHKHCTKRATHHLERHSAALPQEVENEAEYDEEDGDDDEYENENECEK